ncbi:MAG TPA: acetyl-CoA carboxylase biotin carboxyl carrier protein [Anaeromyxobacteraceae bacterium]|jgi:acetyl-CoA carboxylase biotin carboxyl carrier protein|nr:acetyl-CoA carboxylase biotin carboxyl carrier protein [Anaeromyxobacteraceae bacterium]
MARRVERVQQQAEQERAVEAGTGPFTLSDVKKLVEALEGTDVTSLVWSRSGEKVVIRRGEKPLPVTSLPYVAAPSPLAPLAPVPNSAPAAAAPGPGAKEQKPGVIVTSPFVGTFYRAPSPESPPFVEVGAVVKKGQVLCILEAMKLMNEIESEVSGKIAEILVQNATPVEFGEPLFRIEPA